MPSLFTKVSEEVLHHNQWWRYKHDVFTYPDGHRGDYYYGEATGMALVIPMLADGRLVLVKQYRYLTDRQSIEFPGGGINGDEQVSLAAARELMEETGYEVSEMVKIAVFEPYNLFRDTTHVFLGKNATCQSGSHVSPDDTEYLEVMLRWPDEVDAMIKTNEIRDGQTLAAWALARYYV